MIARDKQLHFLGGAAIAVLFIWWAGPWVALGMVALIGLAKELDDINGHGTPEVLDFVWTVAGWVPVAVVWWLWTTL